MAGNKATNGHAHGDNGSDGPDTPAGRLASYWRTNDQRFDDLLDGLLNAGQSGVIDEVTSLLGSEESTEFLLEVEAFAESVVREDTQGDRMVSSLFWLAVELNGNPDGEPPVSAIEEALERSGLLETASDCRILPAWIDPEPLTYLDVTDRRRLLNQMMVSTDAALAFIRAQELELAGDDEEGDEPRQVALLGLLEEQEDPDSGDDTLEDPLRLSVPGEADEDGWGLDQESRERGARAMEAFLGAMEGADPRIRRIIPAGGIDDLLELLFGGGWDEGSALGEILDFLEVARDETEDGVIDADVVFSEGEIGVALRAASGQALDERVFDIAADEGPELLELLRMRCRRVDVTET